MLYDHRYFAEFVPAPERLDDVRQHIEHEIKARSQPIHRAALHNRLLLSGSALAGIPLSLGAQFPDASSVGRNKSDVEGYLERLIAPDTVKDARAVICDWTAIRELDELADELVQLHQLVPAAATALMELRLGTGLRLLERAKADRPCSERERLDHYDHLAGEMARVRVAYVLRMIATDCARQIHQPYGWDAIDGLERPAAAGTLRIGTVIKRMRTEIKLAELAFKLYYGKRPIKRGLLAPRPSFIDGANHLTFSEVGVAPTGDLSAFSALDLHRRASVQLALWRAEHGDGLELLLENTINSMRHELKVLKNRLDAYAAHGGHSNNIAGNIGRLNADVRLMFAVEEAAAWTMEPVSHEGEDATDTGPIERLTAHMKQGTTRLNSIDLAISWLRQAQRGGPMPMPKPHYEHAFNVGRLFVALRYAFLQDNDVLLMKLRTVNDPKTGRDVRVKTHQRAAQLRGRPYSFDEQWQAFKDDRRAKIAALPAKASYAQHSKALQIELNAKDASIVLRKQPARNLAGDTLVAMNSLSAAMRDGFLAP